MLRSRWHEENGRCHVRSWPILLKKSVGATERVAARPRTRFPSWDAEGHVVRPGRDVGRPK
jgi:hypothetical protein